MRPEPPHLVDAVPRWKPQEVFWFIKHGVKMTGMPTFGPTHNDETLWTITAFVMQLPEMTAEEYASHDTGHGKGDSHDRRSRHDKKSGHTSDSPHSH